MTDRRQDIGTRRHRVGADRRGRPALRRALAALALAAATLAVAACSDRAGGAQPRSAPPVPVVVATVEQKVIPLQVMAVGNVQAYTTVAIKSQIAGQIMRVHFKEGQDVKRDDLLFTIDPRPIEAMLRQAEANVARDRAQVQQAVAALEQKRAEVQQAEANLERDRAQMENARVQENRYRSLADQDLVAREQYDQVKTNSSAMQATVQADRAAIDNAKASTQAAAATVENARAVILADQAMVDNARLQLDYTAIRAPMDGRTGNIAVHAGNVVKANEDPTLVTISQVRPIYVSFGVAEQHLTAIKTYRTAGTLKLEAIIDGGRKTVVGEVTFVNSTVDPTTGTIQLKATFPNTDNALWPGQFVDVALTLTTENAILVPLPAVQPGQRGPFVFVVKADGTVESRPVKPGRRLAREIVIEDGVRPGERVVTDGQLRLLPGSRVEIKSETAVTPPAKSS
jgi:multidrug efflux system membrane fusion protein